MSSPAQAAHDSVERGRAQLTRKHGAASQGLTSDFTNNAILMQTRAVATKRRNQSSSALPARWVWFCSMCALDFTLARAFSPQQGDCSDLGENGAACGLRRGLGLGFCCGHLRLEQEIKVSSWSTWIEQRAALLLAALCKLCGFARVLLVELRVELALGRDVKFFRRHARRVLYVQAPLHVRHVVSERRRSAVVAA